MLVVSCVLSLVAVLFAVDLSTFNNNAFPTGTKQNIAHHIDGTSGIPARQQTAVAAQTIRAILTDVNRVKNQNVYHSGSDKALLGELVEPELHKTSSETLFLNAHIITNLRTSHTSARAPPHAI